MLRLHAMPETATAAAVAGAVAYTKLNAVDAAIAAAAQPIALSSAIVAATQVAITAGVTAATKPNANTALAALSAQR